MHYPISALSSGLFAIAWLASGSYAAAQPAAAAPSPAALDRAVYSAAGELQFPPDTDKWIVLGASMGGDYNEAPFDPRAPGVIGVVQIEPAAYDYVRRNGAYADGSMLLLTFYNAESKSDPQLQGFVQGSIRAREIHVIDRARFADEGRAFFLFPGTAADRAQPLPVGSECVVCHQEHGTLDATFAQFYPLLRELTASELPEAGGE